MPAIEVNHITKAYPDKLAVNDLSFSVAQGEIFGLIGPNGAGKTTTIRMMLDIIKPDSGEVAILGKKSSENSKNQVGYLPEERGLYRKLKVMDSILYLASLKGVAPGIARERAEKLLTRTAMITQQNKKIEELSKGMSQIIQFIVTIVHDPPLIILDEPFSSLDPVNTELLKKILLDLRQQGKAIIMSTHQMSQVEELCDRILMINQGQAVLYGSLAEIKSRYRNNAVQLEFQGPLGEIPGVTIKLARQGSAVLTLSTVVTPQQVLEILLNRRIIVNRFEVGTLSLNDIFLREAGQARE